MIKAIIFDFDGVIAESVNIKTEAFAKLFESEGELVAQQVVDYHLKNGGVSRFDKFRHIYRDILNRPLSDSEFQRLCDDFAHLVVDGVVNAPYVPGTKEFLENESSKYTCFVASATPKIEIDEIMNRKDLTSYFAKVYGAPTSKSEAAKEILMCYNLDPRTVLFIGDAKSDYQAAMDNHIHFIARIHDAVFDDINCLKIRDLREVSQYLAKI